jgi:hypothetical protein
LNKYPPIADFGESGSDIVRLCRKKLQIPTVFENLGAEERLFPGTVQ